MDTGQKGVVGDVNPSENRLAPSTVDPLNGPSGLSGVNFHPGDYVFNGISCPRSVRGDVS